MIALLYIFLVVTSFHTQHLNLKFTKPYYHVISLEEHTFSLEEPRAPAFWSIFPFLYHSAGKI